MRFPFALPLLAIAAVSSAGCGVAPPEDEGPADAAPLVLDPWAMKIDGRLSPTAVVSGAAGDVYLGGTFQGNVTFGGGWLTGEDEGTLFVAHLDPQGEHEMSGSTGANDELRSMAVGPDGSFYAAGAFDGSVNFGTGKLTGEHDGYLAAFNADGTSAYGLALPGKGWVYVDGVVTTPDGGVVIGARADDTTDFGAGTISTAQGQAQMVVAAYDRNGKHLWEQRINGYAIDQVFLAADQDGSVLLGGSTYQNVVIGGTTVSYATFVAKLDSEGAVAWVRTTSNESGYLPALRGLSADEEGNVYLAGYYYYDPFAIGGVQVPPSQTQNSYLIKLSPDGEGLWAKGFVSDNSAPSIQIAPAKGGDVLVALTSYYPVDFGGGPVGHVADTDLLIARFDAKGNHLKSMALDGNEDEWVLDLAADPTGKPVIVGMFDNLVDIGKDRLVASGGADTFVARLDF